MRVLFAAAVAALTLLTLSGCKTTPIVVKENKYIVVAPEDQLLEKVAIPTPPNPQHYAAQKDPSKKEEILFKWGMDLTRALNMANEKLERIQHSVANAKAVYQNKAKEVDK